MLADPRGHALVGLRPLAGKRILITRPEGQAEAAAAQVRRLGGEPILLPLIAITPHPGDDHCSAVLGRLGDFDCLVFSSANAVAGFFAQLRNGGLEAGTIGHTRIAAIGDGTAAALASHGLTAAIVPRAFVGEALAQAILDDAAIRACAMRRAPRVLLLRALVAREIVPEVLGRAGFLVEVLPTYATRPDRMRREELLAMLKAQALDGVLLTSSSTAHGLADVLGASIDDLLRGVVVASIGPITTTTALQRGLTVNVTARVHTVAGLLLELGAYWTQGPAGEGTKPPDPQL